MTITIGAWALPAFITMFGWIPAAMQKGDYNVAGAFLSLGWVVASVVAWLTYGVTLVTS